MGHRYVLITSPSCSKCKMVAEALKDKGASFEEVSITTQDGMNYATKYNISSAGTIIDITIGAVVTIDEVV